MHPASYIDLMTSFQSIRSRIKMQCPICYEGFNGKDRLPVLLSCGHSFCKQCIDAGGSHLQKCPHCRKPITQAKDDLLPNHALVAAISLDIDKIERESSSTWFEEEKVPYAKILATMESSKRDSALRKLKEAGFDIDK